MKTSRLSILILSGLLGFTAAARGQFTGSYAIPVAGFTAITPNFTNVPYGNWTLYTIAAGYIDTTNAATNSLELSAVSVGLLNAVVTSRLTTTAATNLNVSFDFNATSVYFDGTPAESTYFAYTVDGWATQTAVFNAISPVSGGTVGPVSVNFSVAAGNQFGMEVYANNSGGGTGGMNAVISNFSAVTAVPEPSTYAAIAGLGAFGLVLLRRRRTA